MNALRRLACLSPFLFGVPLMFGMRPSVAVAENVTRRDIGSSSKLQFDLHKIRTSLARLKAQGTYPPLYPDGRLYSAENKPSRVVLPAAIRAWFAEIQTVVFGRADVLKLMACDGCAPNIEVGTLTVYVDPVWILKILNDPRYGAAGTVVRFALAHEVAHYAYESEVAASGSSPNGQPSYFFVRLHDADFVGSLFARADGPEKTMLLRDAIFEETSRHAEIDGIAKVVMDDLGVDHQCDFVTWLKNWTQVPVGVDAAVLEVAFARINSLEGLLGSACPALP